jgi:hypothetical protein
MEVLFLSSVQGYQMSREQEIADRLRGERPDLAVRVLAPEESGPMLTKCKLKYGPAVLIDNRLEFVGIPRYRMLVERIEIARQRVPASPLVAVPKQAPVAPQQTSSSPAKPSAPNR